MINDVTITDKEKNEVEGKASAHAHMFEGWDGAMVLGAHIINTTVIFTYSLSQS